MAKRRGNNEGSIYRRKDGYWVGQYGVRTAVGIKTRYVYGKRRKDVREKLARAIADRDGGLVYDAGNLTVGEYLGRWLEDSVRGSVKAVTFESYERLVRMHIAPALGQLKLKALTPAHVQGFYRSKLDAGLSARTVQYLHAVLHRALKQALRWNLVPRNACEAVDPPRPSRGEIRPLSPAQARALLRAASGDRLEALYVLAVHCGMRQGELLGLRWDDVDLDAGMLQVRRTLTGSQGGRPVFTGPKTAKSRRAIKLNAATAEALKRHRQRQLEGRIAHAGLWQDHGLVFATGVGTPLNRHNLSRRSFGALLEQAELPKIRFHDLRHKCATILFSRSQHPKLVQELLGHATVAITLDTYSHVLPGMGDGLADAMGQALG